MIRKGFLAICVGWALLAVPAYAETIKVLPAVQSVVPGDTVSLSIVISSLGTHIVGDFDLDVGFNASLLTFNTYSLGGSLGTIPAGAIDFSLGLTGPGAVNLAVVSLLPAAALDALQSDPFTLATLSFTVGGLGPGASTTVQIARVNALGDHAGIALPVSALESAVLNRAGGGVPAVPEPATYLSVGTGLLCLMLSRRWWSSRR